MIIKTIMTWSLLVAILGMGSLYFMVLRMPIMAILEIITIGSWIIVRIGEVGRVSKGLKHNVLVFVLMTSFFLLTSIINSKNGFHVNDLIIWSINFIFVLVLSQNMTFSEFKAYYCKVMCFEAALSIVCFFLVYQFGVSLPLQSFEQTETTGYYLTPYFTVGWINIPLFFRNAGWFWEPGGHQIFLNFALLFLLDDKEAFQVSKKKYYCMITILVLAVLTTLSTTGFICLAVVLLSTAMKRQTSNKIKWMKIVSLCFIVILGIVEINTGVISKKIFGRDDGGSFYTRYNDTIIGYSLGFKNLLFGSGMYAANIAKILEQYNVVNISNGMASFCMRVGGVFTILFTVFMFKAFKRKFKGNWLYTTTIFFFYLLCVNSEAIMLNILPLAILLHWKSDMKSLLSTSLSTTISPII